MLNDFQRQKLTRFFQILDVNKDGVLEADDFDRLAGRLAEVRGLQPGSSLFETNLTLHRLSWWQLEPYALNGRVSLDAFLDFNSTLLAAPGGYDTAVRALAASTFDTLDVDGDGRITIEDQRQCYLAYGIDEALADEVFPKLDRNGDGYLSRAEMQDVMSEFFFSADPDAPGNLFFGPF